MLALPTIMSLMFKIPFGVGLVLPIIYILMYIFLYIPLLNNGAPSRPPLWMLPMQMFSMVGIFYGIWLIQPEVNQLYHKLEQSNPDTDGT